MRDNKNLVKVQIGKVYCLVDLETEDVYSPRMRKLKPTHSQADGCYYYRIFLDGENVTKNKKSILKMAREGISDPEYAINTDKNKLFD